MFDEYPGLAHGCIVGGLFLIPVLLQTVYFCSDLSSQVIQMFGNSVEGGHETSNSYYKEVPIRHIRQYYTRIIDDMTDAKAQRSKMNEKDRVHIYEYIQKLELRVRDIKEIVQEFMKVYAIISDWEEENDKLPADKKTDRKEFYLTIDQMLIEQKRTREEYGKVQTDYELIEDSRVMSTLLFLEEHSRQLYEFYALRPNSDAFRCTSLYKTYRIDESEDFKEAIELYETIKENNKGLVLKNLKNVLQKNSARKKEEKTK